MGSDAGNVFVLDAAAASSGKPRNTVSTATTIVSTTPSPGFRFPTTNPGSKSSLLDPRAQEFWPKPACAPTTTIPFLYPYQYACEFTPVPPCAQLLPRPPRPEARASEFGRIGRENATRSLLLSSVPTNVSEGCIFRELEGFGPVRTVEMEEIQQGVVTVHFFDVRHAQRALMEIQEQHMLQQSRLAQHYTALMRAGDDRNYAVAPPAPVPRQARGLIAGCAVWAQYSSTPMRVSGDGLRDAHNQGTLVVFNLDSEVSSCVLKNIFEAFGPVKELRETPSKRQHRFVEFFDVRDAARALTEMNGKEICGKRVKIEFSRPGGQARRLRHNATASDGFFVEGLVASDPSPSSSIPSQPQSGGRLQANWMPPACSPSENVKGETVARGDFNANNSRVIPRASSAPSSNHGGDKEIVARRKAKNSRGLQYQSSHSLRGSAGASTANFSSVNSKSGACAKNWNVRMNEEMHFAIGEVKAGDPRTTVMIKNIPNKYSQKLLLNMLDQHCIGCNERIPDADDDEPLSAYDFVYLPIDFKNKCNVGYGFVNLTSSKAAWRLHKAFHKQPWEAFNSRKICEVTYARLQGLEALKEHFKNSKFACDTDEYLPVIFCPPRDGKQLSEPTAIGGHTNKSRQPRLIIASLPTNEGSSPSAATIQQHSGGDCAAHHHDDDADVNVATIEGPRLRHLDAAIVDVDDHHPPVSPDTSSPSSISSEYAITNNSNSARLLHSSHEYQQHPKHISCSEEGGSADNDEERDEKAGPIRRLSGRQVSRSVHVGIYCTASLRQL